MTSPHGPMASDSREAEPPGRGAPPSGGDPGGDLLGGSRADEGRRSPFFERVNAALQQGWQAHVLGDRTGALFHLAAFESGVAKLGDDQWRPAIFGLSLYAFTCSSVGDNDRALRSASNVACIARRNDPRQNTAVAIRARLASRLPAAPLSTRLHETVQRWALAVAYGLPSAHLRLVHESDLNRLRAAMRARSADAEAKTVGGR